MYPTFSQADGLALQAKNMLEWKRKLNEETYQLLKDYCDRCNEHLTPDHTGYDVLRGDGLSEFIYNL